MRPPGESLRSGPSRAGAISTCRRPWPRFPHSFNGWIVIEVDVPEAPTNLESTKISAAWIAKQFGPDAFTANQ